MEEFLLPAGFVDPIKTLSKFNPYTPLANSDREAFYKAVNAGPVTFNRRREDLIKDLEAMGIGANSFKDSNDNLTNKGL